MKRIITLMMAGLCLSCSLDRHTVTVSGTVTDGTTGAPVVGAKVTDSPYGGSSAPETLTDEDGRYSYQSSYEEHTVTTSAQGYTRAQKTLTTKSWGTEDSVTLDFVLIPE